MKRRSSGAALVVAALAVVVLPAVGGSEVSTAAGSVPRCTIVGTSGSDRLVGTSGRDVICGAGGNDVIIGGRGDDIIYGGGGHDRIAGSAGNDRIEGGYADDVIDGGDGVDVLLGGSGNDDLAGGPASDKINGETGTNWCKLDAADLASRCVYDKTAPKIDQVVVSARTVDVSSGARTVTVRMHVTDDTGAEYVGVGSADDSRRLPSGYAQRTSGTVRDGWWTAKVTIGKWTVPATYLPQVGATDRVGRSHSAEFPDQSFEIKNANADTDLPEVTLLSPAADVTYDVRSAGVSVKIQARITDAVSGVDEESVLMVVWAPRINGGMSQGYGVGARLTSGTIKDGIWSGSVWISKNHVGGDWNVNITVSDRARAGTRDFVSYWGPAELRDQTGSGEALRPFPYGLGSFPVIGRERTDSAAPVVNGATLSPTSVDTLAGPATVSVSVDASDVGSGIEGMQAVLHPASDDSPPDLDINPRLISGTRAEGTWTGTFVLPQGLPPGTYYLEVYAFDHESNGASYMSSGHPEADMWWHQIPGSPMVTVIDSSP